MPWSHAQTATWRLSGLAPSRPISSSWISSCRKYPGWTDADLSGVPVLAVTAYAGKGDEQRIRDSGAEGYLSKPVSIGPFMAAVKGLMEREAA